MRALQRGYREVKKGLQYNREIFYCFVFQMDDVFVAMRRDLWQRGNADTNLGKKLLEGGNECVKVFFRAQVHPLFKTVAVHLYTFSGDMIEGSYFFVSQSYFYVGTEPDIIFGEAGKTLAQPVKEVGMNFVEVDLKVFPLVIVL